jgi:O-antigen ligase
MGILLVAGLIGIGVSADKSLSWNVYQTLLISVLFYYFFINYDHPRILITSGLLIAALALIVLLPYVWLQEPTSLPFFSQLQSWFHIEPQSSPSGWSSPPLAASACGVTVAAEVVTVIVAGVAIFPGKRTIRIAAGILTFLLLGLLVISGCHATWPVLMVGMLFVLTWRSKWLIFSLPAWLGIVYVSLTTWRHWDFGEAVDWIKVVVVESKWGERWEGTLSMLADRPITGWGLGMYPSVYSEYDIKSAHAHNAYLQFLSDFGLLGAVALILATIIFVKLVLQVRKSSSNHPWLGITVGACAAILVGAVYSLVESAPACIWAAGIDDNYYYTISPLFIILVAVLVVAYRALVVQSSTYKIEKESHPVRAS